MPRGGFRQPSPGKKLGRPERPAPVKVRRDVAHEVLALLNTSLKKRVAAVAKASGEAQFVAQYLFDGAKFKSDQRAFDVYRYMKECVDHKPMVRSEEKVIFDPNQPVRVIVEHIGQPGRRS